jgi:hypothetical protein
MDKILFCLFLAAWAMLIIQHYRVYLKLKNLDTTLQMEVDRFLFKYRFQMMTREERKKLSDQWLIHCVQKGHKVPFYDFVVQKLKEVPHE